MDIYAVIRQDHEAARDLMALMLRARSPERREALVADLRRIAVRHAHTEEATFYRALRRFPELADRMDHAREEHETVETLLDKIAKLAGNQDKFLVEFGEIKMGLESHMREEEQEIFPMARMLLPEGEAERLGDEMRALQEDYVDRSLLLMGIARYQGSGIFY